MKFLLMLFAFFSLPALADDEWKEVCYSDINSCLLVGNEGGHRTIYLPTETYSLNKEVKIGFGALDYRIKLLTPQVKESLANEITEREIRSAEEDSDIWASIPDAEWDFYMSGSACVISAGACGIGLLATLESGGLALLLVRLDCAATIPICLNSWRSWEKFKKYVAKEKKKAEETAAFGNPDGIDGEPIYKDSSHHTVVHLGGGAGSGKDCSRPTRVSSSGPGISPHTTVTPSDCE